MSNRKERLIPNSVPRYIRVYDNGGTTADRYTVIFTQKRVNDMFIYLGMDKTPFHPQGFCQHGESPLQIDVNKWGFAPQLGQRCHLGTRISFMDLPEDCRKIVMKEYKDLWDTQEETKCLDKEQHTLTE